jgi:hypothetical protein
MNRSVAWLAALLLGSTGIAQGAPTGQACGQGGCGAGRIDPAVIRDAVRDAERSTDSGPTRKRAAGALQAATAPDARGGSDSWERRLGGPSPREDYNCVLSFGLGGTLNGDGYIASRLLGRTRVLRGE